MYIYVYIYIYIYITRGATEETSAGRETGEPQGWRTGRKRRREKRKPVLCLRHTQRPTGLLVVAVVVVVVVAVVIIPYGVSRISAFCWIIMKCNQTKNIMDVLIDLVSLRHASTEQDQHQHK